MVLFQKNMSEYCVHIVVMIIVILILLAFLVYLNFVLFKPRELSGLFVLFKIIPTVILSIVIIHFSIGVFFSIRDVYLWNNGKYSSVQGDIEELVIEEFWINGSNAPSYDCSFVVNNIKFPFSNYYTIDEVQSLKSAKNNKTIVRVSYILEFSTKEPYPIRIEIVK